MNLTREIKVPWIPRACNRSERGAAERAIGTVQRGRVRNVKHLGPKFKADALKKEQTAPIDALRFYKLSVFGPFTKFLPRHNPFHRRVCDSRHENAE